GLRSGQIDSTAEKIGSGFSSIPSPPPKGRSSTVLCRSAVQSRRLWMRISTAPASRPRLSTPCSNGPRKNSGNIVSTWNITAYSVPLILPAIPQQYDVPQGRSPDKLSGQRGSSARLPLPAAPARPSRATPRLVPTFGRPVSLRPRSRSSRIDNIRHDQASRVPGVEHVPQHPAAARLLRL